MLVTDFNYNLPNELIAQHPALPRDHARLLVYNKETGAVEHKHFYDLIDYLKKDDLLVFNDTRVIPARLYGRKTTGAKVEVFLLSRINNTEWEALVKPGKKLKIGTVVEFSEELSCEIVKHTDFGGRIVKFKFDGNFENILEKLGETPLPPYINAKLEDSELYQTVYSKQSGSAAAPTAGLHFTKEMLEKIEKSGIETAFVTLHVGLGTFRPVNELNILDHHMHREFYSVSKEAADKINKAKQEGRRIVAVGTTSVRTLESAGESGIIKAGGNWTEIFIYPGYKYKFVDALVTNFHLPQSTLLMLVSALSSREKILNAYKIAVDQKYRFFSFGDAMFIR